MTGASFEAVTADITTWMHRVEVAVLDTDDGRAAMKHVLGAIRVHSWERST